jgi:hypothetical protein
MYASQKIHQIKVSNDLQEKMKTKISDILINIFFTLILLFVVHNYRSVESCYLQSKSVENMFIQDEFVHVSFVISCTANLTVVMNKVFLLNSDYRIISDI